MAAVVGIPRGLLYYKYFPLWEGFLSGLGAEVHASACTNKRTVNAGVSVADNEICLPVKVFYGHCVEFKDKADYLFIPRVVSIEKQSYTCPKFLGLPDMIRALGDQTPPVVAPVFNKKLGRRHFYRTIFEVGALFGRAKLETLVAWRRGERAQAAYEAGLRQGLLPDELVGRPASAGAGGHGLPAHCGSPKSKASSASCAAAERGPAVQHERGMAERGPAVQHERGMAERGSAVQHERGMAERGPAVQHERGKAETMGSAAAEASLRIGLAGHPYNLYDSYISMNLIKRLRKMGATPVTGETVPGHVIERELERLPKNLFWSYEKEVVGGAFHWMNTKSVDGIIYLLSFACGPDSLIQVLLENEAKKQGVALMPLVIDEHSGEAGLVTRVEAFVDMLKRKKAPAA